ncbi:MAG: NAD-dependent epimerase/dehydratase family protein [Candidatus Dormibacteria bacterium]
MTQRSTLVTGGCGFVGSHLVDALLAAGHTVRVLDNVDPQAHEGGVARFRNPDAEMHRADLRDRQAVRSALEGVDTVFHQGAMVGNGQSMYEIERYIDVNAVGTAVLMEEVVSRRDRIRRVVAASSMVVYGDGAYRCAEHGMVKPPPRTDEDLAARRWEPRCPTCTEFVSPMPTDEEKPLDTTSPYAIGKLASETIVLVTGRSFGVETVALRYLNIYGRRQALSNPYTGVAAIFATQLRSGRRPTVYEDGGQRRDLIHVSDVVAANLLAMEAPAAAGRALNVGTGVTLTIAGLARTLADALGVDTEPDITNRYRAGDVRHCYASTERAKALLGFSAAANRESALRDLAEWVTDEKPVDRTETATAELTALGLIR